MVDRLSALVEYGKDFPVSAILLGVTLLAGAVHESRILVVLLTAGLRFVEREVSHHEKDIIALRKVVARLRESIRRLLRQIAIFKDPDDDQAGPKKRSAGPAPIRGPATAKPRLAVPDEPSTTTAIPSASSTSYRVVRLPIPRTPARQRRKSRSPANAAVPLAAVDETHRDDLP
jgi:hypothetical protein